MALKSADERRAAPARHRARLDCTMPPAVLAGHRIALFQHFPADVVAGGIIGTCSIFAAIWLARLLEKKFPQLRDNL